MREVKRMKKTWWQGKIAYQIYPKSFLDTTGNGIGDIRGIISKLDYLKKLHVGILWLSPCFLSPLADEGYDIADYYRIDPRFGSNEDLFTLVEEGKKRGISVILDLVVNHCSDEHEWFQAALADPEGPYGKYFYIEEGVDGHAPNNWRSYFGGSVWEPIPGTNKYYLHLFHKKQPDLNWENPRLREEIYKMINWWLDRGIAGFRIDAIMNIKKVFPLAGHDYPADREDGLSSCAQMIQEARGIGDFFREMRDRCFVPHDAFAVAEVFDERPEQASVLIGSEDGYFSSMFDFQANCVGRSDKGWYDGKPVGPDQYRDACYQTQKIIGKRGFISTIIENHDEPRGVSRYIPAEELSDRSKKFLGTMQLMLRGLPFIYQGQEIGMENTHVDTPDQISDISARDEYRVAREAGLSQDEAMAVVNRMSRDNARTPVQWSDAPQAGFTSGKPWLAVNPNYKKINVAAQEKDPDSVLNYYRRLTALRSDPVYGDSIVHGDFDPFMPEEPRFMSFYRRGDKKLLVLGNFSMNEKKVRISDQVKKVVLSNVNSDPGQIRPGQGGEGSEGTEISLAPYQALILELA